MTLPWMAAKILLRPVAELRAHPGNARVHGAAQIEQIKASMLAFGRELRVRVEGQLIFSNVFQALNAALAGFGLAYVPEDIARPHIAAGRLQWVLEDWSPPFPGYHLYYPSRRQSSPAFALLVDALRHRG